MRCLLITALIGCSSMDEQQAFEAWSAAAQGVTQRPSLDAALRGTTDTPQEDETFPEDPTLGHYLVWASIHNTGLKAAFDRWKAALERIPQARTLPDPRFHYRYFIEQVETRVGPQRQAFGLSQHFPWFGKLALRSGVAVEAARAAQARFEADKFTLFYRVKKAYYEYYYLGRAIKVVRENRDLVTYLEDIARVRFKTATAGHPDVIRAQIELGKLDDQLRTLEDLRDPMTANLNALLSRPAQARLPWPQPISEQPVEVNDSQLFHWLGQSNPSLLVMRHEIAKKREQIRQARKSEYPDLTVGVDYIDTAGAVASGVSDSGKDPVSVSLSINLPIWRERYDAAVRESLASFGAATRMRLDRQHSLEADLQTAIHKLRDASRKINLYRDTLVPKATQSIKATEAAFRTGTASFRDLIDAQRVLLEFRLAFERALTDHGQHLAKIEMLVGRRLPHRPDATVISTQPHPQDTVPIRDSTP